MSDQNTDGSVLAARLDGTSGLKGGGLDARAWHNSAKETIADFPTLGESVFQLDLA